MAKNLHAVMTAMTTIAPGRSLLVTTDCLVEVKSGGATRSEILREMWDRFRPHIGGLDPVRAFWSLEDDLVPPGRTHYAITLQAREFNSGTDVVYTQARSGVFDVPRGGGSRAELFGRAREEAAAGMRGGYLAVVSWVLAPERIAD